MYESLESLLIELSPFLILPVTISALSFVFRLVKELAQGSYTAEMAEELKKENDKLINEEKEKISIDKDLQKYFNYKE